jgi:dTDP-4-dehydrorhamnose 3,5-epimerase
VSLEAVSGVHVEAIRCFEDERGSLYRLFDDDYFAASDHAFRASYTLLSRNPAKRTLRGLHYQEAPFGEHKVVSCLSGAIFLAVLDLRPESDSFLTSGAMTFAAADRKAVYVPAGLALGWMTLDDHTDVHYTIDGEFNASASRGVRFDDPVLSFAWPSEPRVMSQKDLSWPSFPVTAQGNP